MARGHWTTCPSCGLRMPADGSPVDRRYEASGECLALYYEVTGRALNEPVLVSLHQLTIDTYAAQHASPAGPAIGTAFALLGLHWALDRGLSGLQVRAAHQALAPASKDWPAFTRPPRPGRITVLEVAEAGGEEQHRDAVYRWAAAVWGDWRTARPYVEQLTERHWPLIARAAGV